VVKLATPLHAAPRNLRGSRLHVCPPAPLRPFVSSSLISLLFRTPLRTLRPLGLKRFKPLTAKSAARQESKTVQRKSS